jgi:hypothetical protein
VLAGFNAFDRRRLSRRILSLTVPGAAALAVSALAGVWILYLRPVAVPHGPVAHVAAAPTADPKSTATPETTAAANPYGGLFDPRFSTGSAPFSLAYSAPPETNFDSRPPSLAAAEPEPENGATAPEGVETAPLPPPRPAGVGSAGPLQPARRLAQQTDKTALPAAPSDNRSFFEKIFGGLAPQPSRPVLAYAAPESGVAGAARNIVSAVMPPSDRQTAVYDVAAHTVYLPNGTRLEAHSGLGDRLDDPRYVHEPNRGATPPSVYELSPREQLFHGVQALRLKPVGGADPYGRVGLLAHTYMLGPNGDSNGCVSFKNYGAFLQAYQNGEVKRLVVVARRG